MDFEWNGLRKVIPMRSLLLSLIFFLSSSAIFSQAPLAPILERQISISLVNESIPSALNRIGKLGGFSFSYNAAIISSSETVSIEATGKTVREILNEIFKGSMNYKDKGKHLILTRVQATSAKETSTIVIISGYIEDEKTGEKLADASVYEKNTLASAVTISMGSTK
jgi:Tymovirus coat protein.